MNADPELHSRCHALTERDIKLLLDYVLTNMAFSEDDIIMDIGCGSGDNTKDVILPRIPKLNKIIGLDVIPKSIEFARAHKASEKIEYHVADAGNWNSLKKWEGTASKVFSSFCFHWLKDQEKAFRCLYDLLKPKGEAALVFMLSSSMWACYPFVVSDSKWKEFLQDAESYVPDSQQLNHGAEYYEKIFRDLGFEIVTCVEEKRTYDYKTSAFMKTHIKLYSALMYHIPEELQDAFLNDFLKVYTELHGDNSVYHYGTLTVHIRKP